MEPSWHILGHPDLLDKLHFATRGGVSKASKEINLSEDIFSGYKTVLAGGCVVLCCCVMRETERRERGGEEL